MNRNIPVKILFLVADPSDAVRLRLGQELRDIAQRLRLSNERDRYQLEQRHSVRVGDITQAIFQAEPQIIHFSGHGTEKGELCFENELGKIQPVEADALAKMFKLFSQKLKINCIVLNACYSQMQAKAIAEHIPFVIGMNDAIGDKAASKFSVGFYTALFSNSSIEDAYEFGCTEINLQGIPEDHKPVIRVNKDLLASKQPIPPNPFLPQTGRVEDSQKLFGRQREIRRVFETLNSGSSVALIGERSIGKSSLLWAIKQQAESQLMAPRKSIYLDMSQVYDEEDFYYALCSEIGIEQCKGFRLTRALNKQRPRLLLLLDEIEKMTWQGFTNQVRGQLRGLANGRDAPLRLVVAASTSLDQLFPDSHELGMVSPFQNICLEEEIKLWDEGTVRDFIRSHLASTSIRFTDEEVMQIVMASRGHPQELMQLCHRTYDRYRENLR